MSSALMMFFLLFCCAFGAMYISFAPQARKYLQTLELKFYMLPIIYIWLFYGIGCLGAYFLTDNNDFIEPLTLTRLLLPLGLSVLIYVASLFLADFGFAVALSIAVIILVLAQPLGEGSSFPELPNWSVRIGTIVFGILFCWFYKLMNSTAQSFIIPILAILFGISILSTLGAAPMFCALCAAVFMGLLTAYLSINFYGEKIDLDSGSCTVIAFLIFSILVTNIGEFCFASCLIFTTVFWVELLAALWHRYFVTHEGSLMENSNYYLAATKYSHNILALNIFKICAICIFLGWFQLFSINTFSLPLVALLIIMWLNSSFGRSSIDEPKNLKEINQAFVQDLKQNIQTAKDALNMKQKDK
jgi:hypothetical protein